MLAEVGKMAPREEESTGHLGTRSPPAMSLVTVRDVWQILYGLACFTSIAACAVFAEMAWKKRQKAAKAKWEAENSGANPTPNPSASAAAAPAPPPLALPLPKHSTAPRAPIAASKSTPSKSTPLAANKALSAGKGGIAQISGMCVSACLPDWRKDGLAHAWRAAMDIGQLKMELTATFRQELEATKADILVQVAQMIKDGR